MALTTKAGLKTAMQEYATRSDASDSVMDDFITLFEARANIDLKVRGTEVDTTLTGTIDQRTLTLPSDFMEPVALWLTTFGVEDDPLAPIIAGNYPLKHFSGVPEAWMINGSNIDLDKLCDQSHTFRFRYRMKGLDLNNTSPNYVLTNYPNVYLWGCLVEFSRWAKAWEQAAFYETMYQQAKNDVVWIQARSKSIAPLRVDEALIAAGGFNINTGE